MPCVRGIEPVVSRASANFVEAMPPAGHKLTDEEATALYRWIAQGAEWPEKIVLKPPPDA